MTNAPTHSREWRTLTALVPAPGGAVICAPDGDCRRIGLDEARLLFRGGDVLVAHAAFVSGRLKAPPASALFDVLELFAFVRPAVPCVPSALGLARALGLPPPHTHEDSARALREGAFALFALLDETEPGMRPPQCALAASLHRAGWRWAPAILAAL